jgi:hypothetical protein
MTTIPRLVLADIAKIARFAELNAALLAHHFAIVVPSRKSCVFIAGAVEIRNPVYGKRSYPAAPTALGLRPSLHPVPRVTLAILVGAPCASCSFRSFLG